MTHLVFPIDKEPTIDLVQDGVEQAKTGGCDLVIGFGGGSAIDAGKAIAALATNPGHPLDYLEVIGQGKALVQPPLPFIAIPTTAGTGAEVTRNAVLASPAHRVKVSLRSPLMLPDVALVDPELTYSMPPAVTASTGMDALTQVLEPFVSHLANPLTDAICREGLRVTGLSLQRAYEHSANLIARENMALVSLFGGLALANAKLGAVHGFAGVLGGMVGAPHGAICASLLPQTMSVNARALQGREPNNPALFRYLEASCILTGRDDASIEDGILWVRELSQALDIPPMSNLGLQRADIPNIVEQSARSSSMKGNPITLTEDELTEILEKSF